MNEEIAIWKYPLKLMYEQTIAIPDNAEVLSAGMDPGGQLCVWVLTCPTWAIANGRKIYVVGTGHPMRQNVARHFVGTVADGSFMWHIFQARQ